MATVYLELDDEITSAIARIRAVRDGEAIVVVPAGSKVATSRINFKLLAREAAERRMNVVAVSDEPQVRALAISAGLPAYDSVLTAERALATFREQDRRLSERVDRTMPRQHPGADVTAAPAGAAGLAHATRTQVLAPSVVARGANVPVDTAVHAAGQAAATRRPPRTRRVPVAPLIVVGLLGLLMLGVGYGALVYLPTATVTLRPSVAQVVSPSFTVTADPASAVVDVSQRTIPAQHLSVPVHVSGTFAATGIDAHDTKASGTVRFRSENTLNAVPIPAGTIVATAGGTEFATVSDVLVPRASFATGPQTAVVDVHAVKGGSNGNVGAGAITLVPAPFAAQLITVTNPGPTTGGKHTENQVVTQADYDGALSTLSGELGSALATALADPAAVPHGLIAFAPTAQLSAGEPDQPANALVGSPTTSFDLGLDATADVVAVNQSLIDQMADQVFRSSMAADRHVLGSVAAIHDAGRIVGSTIVYDVAATAYVYETPSTKDVLDRVVGKSVSAARAALAYAGTADITLWPEFVDHLPDQAGRISVSVAAPTVVPSLAPATLPPTSLPPASSLPPAASPPASGALPSAASPAAAATQP